MDNRGTILLMVIIVLIFLAVLGMSLLGLLFSRISLSLLNIDRLKAFYLAEAGIAKSLNELKTDMDYDRNGTGNVKPTKLGEGTFWANHNFQTSIITAVGMVNNVKRTIQIKYAVF
ncbi:MAG: hypothetical protein ABIH27_04180 [Candidatus Omnitrophota bacterium]